MSILSRRTAALLSASLVLTALVSATAYAVAQRRGDYSHVHNFTVEIDGVVVGGFKEISGIESETEVVEYQDGNDQTTHYRPGRVKYGNLVLKRDFAGDDIVREWYQRVLKGATERKSISIVFRDRAGQEALRYNFFEAWPCRWKAPELNSKGTGITEGIEFCVELVERKL